MKIYSNPLDRKIFWISFAADLMYVNTKMHKTDYIEPMVNHCFYEQYSVYLQNNCEFLIFFQTLINVFSFISEGLHIYPQSEVDWPTKLAQAFNDARGPFLKLTIFT